ncbi:hypothetical protein CKN99_09310 [Carnobacterium maltaromaticum]|uniref:Uncharacterized protein n=1 Tax=Carnobacterium maltaromaticum TaxID=2751 RepID=A0AAW9JN45_CARML|nr:hypothetical protein [Carnobacterium maltaromaticum]KRN87925.1 hypothetical protein IV75_GL002639 [Carnobacterium maltaromaticum]MBC9789515.1 hypothetical protein [Carnobacterium maltaromaticum]MCC4310695.1 hypothetical protein [Carnobacterium maltaromaticum]MDT1944095.1 hypothetical protein [Carnobacterium maltaromaticum]MDT1998183.1 hypothetical protein [Carnobacterium maltaromaticum]
MNGQFNLKTLEKSQQIIALFLLIISMFILISILIYTYLPSLFFFSSILNDYHYTAINKFTAGPISQLLIGSGFLLASLLLLTKHLIVPAKLASVLLFFVAISNKYRFHFTTWFIPKPLFFFLLLLVIFGLFYSHDKKRCGF